MQKNKPTMLREECYNCHKLYGFTLNPQCRANKNPMRGELKSKCSEYLPINIFNEKVKGEVDDNT